VGPELEADTVAGLVDDGASSAARERPSWRGQGTDEPFPFRPFEPVDDGAGEADGSRPIPFADDAQHRAVKVF
jgi:hypothetical protein